MCSSDLRYRIIVGSSRLAWAPITATLCGNPRRQLSSVATLAWLRGHSHPKAAKKRNDQCSRRKAFLVSTSLPGIFQGFSVSCGMSASESGEAGLRPLIRSEFSTCKAAIVNSIASDRLPEGMKRELCRRKSLYLNVYVRRNHDSIRN